MILLKFYLILSYLMIAVQFQERQHASPKNAELGYIVQLITHRKIENIKSLGSWLTDVE